MLHPFYTYPFRGIFLAGFLLSHFRFSVAHVYIKSWKSTSDDNFQLAQKQPAPETAYRAASDNTGWIGSQFISGDRSIVCGASSTPFAQVSSPGGKFFSDQSEAAGKTLSIAAGGKITLVTAGEPGKGFPHPDGHIQVYLGYCGPSKTACQSFDAATTDYFKIQEVKNGVQDKLRPAMDYSLDGNVWEVPIPAEVPQGSYIFRFEIIAFNQSNGQEGNQDQYYPSCGQLYVESSHQIDTLSTVEKVKFPGAYKNGNIDQASAPGPSVAQLANRGESGGSQNSDKIVKSNSSGSENSKEIRLAKVVPSCAEMCLARKKEEAKSLADGCPLTDGKCLCSKETFLKAYMNCTRDNCPSEEEANSAVTALKSQCDRLSKKRGLRASHLSLHRRHRPNCRPRLP